MNKDQNFLNKLKDNSVQPPDMLFQAIRQRIEESKAEAAEELASVFKKLADKETAPPLFLQSAILKAIEDKKFLQETGLDQLIDHEIQPPAHLFENIQKQIKAVGKKSNKAVVININSFKQFRMPVAASLLLCLMAGLIFKKFNFVGSHQNSENFYTTETAINTPDTSLNTLNKIEADKGLPKDKTAVALRTKTKTLAPVNNEGNSSELLAEKALNIGGMNIPFVDNDFFATFTSFNYVTTDIFKNVPEGQDLVVRLNNYSAISISSKMQAMMKKMYKTKRNGKIPNSAKKLQKKLLGWKVDDNKAFDSDEKKSPLDTIDLLDFLMENK